MSNQSVAKTNSGWYGKTNVAPKKGSPSPEAAPSSSSGKPCQRAKSSGDDLSEKIGSQSRNRHHAHKPAYSSGAQRSWLPRKHSPEQVGNDSDGKKVESSQSWRRSPEQPDKSKSTTGEARNLKEKRSGPVRLDVRDRKLLPYWDQTKDDHLLNTIFMMHYGVQPCGGEGHHEDRICGGFHVRDNRRRCPVGPDGRIRYWDIKCPYFESPNQCPDGDDCTMSHTINEMSYHVAKYKTRFCVGNMCRGPEMCCFAHNDTEYRSEADTMYSFNYPRHQQNINPETLQTVEFYTYKFKTVWCPVEEEHDWATCVFAHNYSDMRRDPRVGYGPEPCQHWNSGEAASTTRYEDLCPRGVVCPLSHGVNERAYHPYAYKTSRCSNAENNTCTKGSSCQDAHEEPNPVHPFVIDYNMNMSDQSYDMLQFDFAHPTHLVTGDLHSSKPTITRQIPLMPSVLKDYVHPMLAAISPPGLFTQDTFQSQSTMNSCEFGGFFSQDSSSPRGLVFYDNLTSFPSNPDNFQRSFSSNQENLQPSFSSENFCEYQPAMFPSAVMGGDDGMAIPMGQPQFMMVQMNSSMQFGMVPMIPSPPSMPPQYLLERSSSCPGEMKPTSFGIETEETRDFDDWSTELSDLDWNDVSKDGMVHLTPRNRIQCDHKRRSI